MWRCLGIVLVLFMLFMWRVWMCVWKMWLGICWCVLCFLLGVYRGWFFWGLVIGRLFKFYLLICCLLVVVVWFCFFVSWVLLMCCFCFVLFWWSIRFFFCFGVISGLLMFVGVFWYCCFFLDIVLFMCLFCWFSCWRFLVYLCFLLLGLMWFFR